jgi:hypothetical protein
MSDDLVARLRHAWDERERQLDEDERVALEATQRAWRWADPGGRLKYALMAGEAMVVPSARPDVYPSRYDAEHIARHDPARVLADVERGRRDIAAKRLMVEECLYEIGKSAPRSRLNDLAWSMLLQLAEAEGLP